MNEPMNNQNAPFDPSLDPLAPIYVGNDGSLHGKVRHDAEPCDTYTPRNPQMMDACTCGWSWHEHPPIGMSKEARRASQQQQEMAHRIRFAEKASGDYFREMERMERQYRFNVRMAFIVGFGTAMAVATITSWFWRLP